MNLVRNHWYIACRSKQLGPKKPIARVLLGERLVLFRNREGVVGCLPDRCAHRNLALSRGDITDKGLRCAYHGWTWGVDGRCTEIPSACCEPRDDGEPACAKIKMRPFRVHEKQGFVWVWFGYGKPPPAGQPGHEPIDFPRFDEAGWHHWVMEREFPGHAFHCVENFLDVPHTAHVHKGLFRGAESKVIELDITYGPDWVQAEFLGEKRMESIIGRLLVPDDSDIYHTDRFQLPYVTRVDYRMSEKRQYIVMSQCTPISQTETRVFTYMAYRFAPLGRLLRLGFEPLSRIILKQDVHIIRDQSEDIAAHGGETAFLYHETDAIADAIRRLLEGESLENSPSERKRLRV